MKKYTLISAGLSVALFGVALTVSLVNNSKTNNKFDAQIEDINKIVEANKQEGLNKVQDLQTKLDATKTDLSTAVETNKQDLLKEIANAKAALEEALNTQKADYESKVSALTEATNGKIKGLEEKIATEKKALEEAIAAADKTLDEKIVALTEATTQKVTALEKQIEAEKKAFDTKLSEQKKALEGQITALTESSNKKISDLQAKLEGADKKNREEIEAQIAAEKAALTKSIDAAKAESKAAVEALTTQHNADVKVLTESIATEKAALTELINAAKTELDGKITSLTAKHDEEVAGLNTLIENNKTELQTKLNTLNTLVGKVSNTLKADIDSLKESEAALTKATKDNAQAIVDAKTELQNALNTAKEALEGEDARLEGLINGIETRLAAVETTRLQELQTAIDNVQSALNTLESRLDAKDLEILGKVTELTTKVDEAISRIDAAHATLVADVESFKGLTNQQIEELKNSMNSQATDSSAALKSWTDDFNGTAIVNKKADAVWKLFTESKAQKNQVAELLKTLYPEWESSQADAYKAALETKTVAIDKIYNGSVVKITLANGKDLDAQIKAIEDEYKAVAETIRLDAYKATIDSSFAAYQAAKCAEVDALATKLGDVSAIKAAINGVTLKPYADLETSDAVEDVLEDAMFEAYKITVEAKASVKVVDAVAALDVVNGKGHISTEYYDAMKAKIQGIKIDADALKAVVRDVENDEPGKNVENVESNTALDELVKTTYADLPLLLELANREDLVQEAKATYSTEWFADPDGKLNKYEESKAQLADAVAAYDAVLAAHPHLVVPEGGLEAIKADHDALIQELKDAMAPFEKTYRLAHKRTTANTSFEALKNSTKDYIDTLELTADEKTSFKKMVHVIELPDVSSYTEEADIDAAVTTKTNLVNNVKAFADLQSQETLGLTAAKAPYLTTEYTNLFKVKELADINTLLDNINKAHTYTFDTVGKTTAEVVAIVEALNPQPATAELAEEKAELQLVNDKYVVVKDVRAYTKGAVLDVNSMAPIFGESVSNDYAFRFRDVSQGTEQDFSINPEDTLETIKVNGETYQAQVKAIHEEAKAIKAAIEHYEAQVLVVKGLEKGSDITLHLTASEVAGYVTRIDNLGYKSSEASARKLYDGVEAGGIDTLATYKTNIDTIVEEAKALNKVREDARIEEVNAHELADSLLAENLIAKQDKISELDALFHTTSHEVKFTDEEWNALTKIINDQYAAHDSAINAKVTQAEVRTEDAKFDGELVAWAEKVVNDYKTKDAPVLADKIVEITQAIEEYTIARTDLPVNATLEKQILTKRNEYKRTIKDATVCVYSYQVLEKFEQFKQDLKDLGVVDPVVAIELNQVVSPTTYSFSAVNNGDAYKGLVIIRFKSDSHNHEITFNNMMVNGQPAVVSERVVDGKFLGYDIEVDLKAGETLNFTADVVTTKDGDYRVQVLAEQCNSSTDHIIVPAA